MMKRTMAEVNKAILLVLAEHGPCSMGLLERKVNTSWVSVRKHIRLLKRFDAVEHTEKGWYVTYYGARKDRQLREADE